MASIASVAKDETDAGRERLRREPGLRTEDAQGKSKKGKGEDKPHSEQEARYYVLGTSDAGRLLFIVFAVRGDQIRVVSARDMNKKERRKYDEDTQ